MDLFLNTELRTILQDIQQYYLQETLKMMGIGSWLQWLAWFVKYFLFLLIAVAIMTLFFSIKVSIKYLMKSTQN